MDKPPWINEVKEIDREEAIVLLNLGVPVWRDYSKVDGSVGWMMDPFGELATLMCHTQAIPDKAMEWYDVFYVKPGETNESTS